MYFTQCSSITAIAQSLTTALKLHLTTSEQWFGQEQEVLLPELLSSSVIV